MVNTIFGGMSFNNAGLGYVHSWLPAWGSLQSRRTVSAISDALPVVERENAKRVPEAFRNVAKAPLVCKSKARLTKNVQLMPFPEIEKLSETVGVFRKNSLNLVSKKRTLTLITYLKNALIDACAPGNPFMQL